MLQIAVVGIIQGVCNLRPVLYRIFFLSQQYLSKYSIILL